MYKWGVSEVQQHALMLIWGKWLMYALCCTMKLVSVIDPLSMWNIFRLPPCVWDTNHCIRWDKVVSNMIYTSLMYSYLFTPYYWQTASNWYNLVADTYCLVEQENLLWNKYIFRGFCCCQLKEKIQMNQNVDYCMSLVLPHNVATMCPALLCCCVVICPLLLSLFLLFISRLQADWIYLIRLSNDCVTVDEDTVWGYMKRNMLSYSAYLEPHLILDCFCLCFVSETFLIIINMLMSQMSCKSPRFSTGTTCNSLWHNSWQMWDLLQIKCSKTQKSIYPHVLLHMWNKWQNEPALLTDVLTLAASLLLPTMFLLGSNHSQ